MVLDKKPHLTRQMLVVYVNYGSACVCSYQSQNRKGREILPSLSYHSNENIVNDTIVYLKWKMAYLGA